MDISKSGNKILRMLKTAPGWLFVAGSFGMIWFILSSITAVSGNADFLWEALKKIGSSPAATLLCWLLLSFVCIFFAVRDIGKSEQETQKVLDEIKTHLSDNRHLISLYRQRKNIEEHQTHMAREINEFRRHGIAYFPSMFPVDEYNSSKSMFGARMSSMETIDSSNYVTKNYDGMENMDEGLKPEYRRFKFEEEAVKNVLSNRLNAIRVEINQLETSIVRNENTIAN